MNSKIRFFSPRHSFLTKQWRIAFLVLLLGCAIWVFTGAVIRIGIKVNNWKKLSEIESVDKNSYRIFSQFISDIESQTAWQVEIISGWRSREKQRELVRENAKNASVEKSRHILGRAIDINLYKGNWVQRIWLKKFNSKRDWRNSGVVQIAERYGLTWGGTYRSYHDPVHFEIK